jgi:hypothetical protein
MLITYRLESSHLFWRLLMCKEFCGTNRKGDERKQSIWLCLTMGPLYPVSICRCAIGVSRLPDP